MMPDWTEVNAAIAAVLGEFGRTSIRSLGRQPISKYDVFSERLFSVKHAEMMGDVDEVRVVTGTVVTPMARELLKRRKVSIRIVSGNEASLAKSRSRGDWGFCIESNHVQVEVLRRTLLGDWSDLGMDPAEAALWVTDEAGRGALVVTDEASVASWRVGRIGGIRSATVFDPEGVSRAIRQLGANMIVIEPSGKSIYVLKQFGERFRQGGAPMTPEWLGAEAMR